MPVCVDEVWLKTGWNRIFVDFYEHFYENYNSKGYELFSSAGG